MSGYTKIIAITLLALLNAGIAKSQRAHEFSIKLSQPSKAGKLEMDIFDGTVKIVGYDGKEIQVSTAGPSYDMSKKQIHNQGPDVPKDLPKNLNFDISQKNNVVNITVEKPNIVNFVIKVPRNFSVVLKILAAGDIQIENVDGDHEVSMSNGDITMLAISGSVLANTQHGNIKVDMKAIKKNTPLALSNVGGNIELIAPANLKANVKLQTGTAEIHSDFDIDNKPDISAPKQGSNTLSGKINGGGSDILLKSFGGKIDLRKKI